jgi:hypothetical protein
MILFDVARVSLSILLGATTPMPPAYADTGSTAKRDTASHVLLSVDMFKRLAAFMDNWDTLSAAIKDTATQQYVERFTMPVTEIKGILLAPVLVQLDMVALAARVPAVADAFRRANLTPKEWEQDSRTLYLAYMTDQVDHGAQLHGDPATPSHQSVVWQNVEFLRTHRDELESLQSKMWLPTIAPPNVPMVSDTVNQHPY